MMLLDTISKRSEITARGGNYMTHVNGSGVLHKLFVNDAQFVDKGGRRVNRSSCDMTKIRLKYVPVHDVTCIRVVLSTR